MYFPLFLQHEPSRGIGGEPNRSGDSPPRRDSHPRGQTANRQVARRVNLSSAGGFSNMTKDVLKYATIRAISEEEALPNGLAEKSKEIVTVGAVGYAKT